MASSVVSIKMRGRLGALGAGERQRTGAELVGQHPVEVPTL